MTRLTAAQRALCIRLDRGEPEPSAAEWAALRDQHRAECAPPLPPDCPRPLGVPHHASTDRF